MQTINIHSIQVPNRQRKEFDADSIQELRKSIEQLGLFHAIGIRFEDNKPVLVYGERRLRAIRSACSAGVRIRYNEEELPEGHIPYVDVSGLTEIQTKEAELHENVMRMDITWREDVDARAEIHALTMAEAAAKGKTATTVDAVKKMFELAGTPEKQVTTRAQTTMGAALEVHKHMDDPNVKKARSFREATREVRKIKERTARASALADLKAESEKAKLCPHTLLKGNSHELIKQIEAGTVSTIITDPPYGMNAGSFGTGSVHTYEDDKDTALAAYQMLATEGYRITKERAHIFAFCDIEFFLILRDMFSEAGWKPFRTPFIWSKGLANNTEGHFPWPQSGPRRTYEFIFYANKGDKPFAEMPTDVQLIAPVPDRQHPAEKPFELYKKIISFSDPMPGNVICDPFCGAGPIFTAARAFMQTAIGIEQDPNHCTTAEFRRLGEKL